MASSQCRLTADLSPEGCYGREWNALIKLDGRFDPPLIAGLASFHHSEEGLRQDFGRDVLGLAVRLDQCDEPEVGCRTDWRHNGRAFRHRWPGHRQADARYRPKSKCDNREKACAAQDLRIDGRELAVDPSAPIRGDANVRQHTIVELPEFANITVSAPPSG